MRTLWTAGQRNARRRAPAQRTESTGGGQRTDDARLSAIITRRVALAQALSERYGWTLAMGIDPTCNLHLGDSELLALSLAVSRELRRRGNLGEGEFISVQGAETIRDAWWYMGAVV